MPATDTDAERWAESFRAASDADAQIQAHGRHYSCTYQLDMEAHRVLVTMHRGRVEAIAVDASPLESSYDFGLRASADTWRRMAQPQPEPMYHGIFAANARRDLRFEGDLLTMMQNLRCFVRHVELLRTTGVPV
jgi:hypothetical protein